MDELNMFKNCTAENSGEGIICNWGDGPPPVFKGCTVQQSETLPLAILPTGERLPLNEAIKKAKTGDMIGILPGDTGRQA